MVPQNHHCLYLRIFVFGLGSSLFKPHFRLFLVHRRAIAVVVHRATVALGFGVTLLGGLLIPIQCPFLPHFIGAQWRYADFSSPTSVINF